MLSLALSPLSLSGLAPRSVSVSRVAAPEMVQSKSMPMMEAPEVRALPAALPWHAHDARFAPSRAESLSC